MENLELEELGLVELTQTEKEDNNGGFFPHPYALMWNYIKNEFTSGFNQAINSCSC